MKRVRRWLLELIFPSNIYCISCGRPILPEAAYALCADCLKGLLWANGRTCAKCGKILQNWHKDDFCFDCGKTTHVFAQGFSCVQYGDREREIVHRLKYGRKGYFARKLADMMKDRILLENLSIHCIIPVPMYKEKEAARGYNQAALLAESLADSLRTPCERTILRRIRDTEPMNQLSPADRRTNMRGAFDVLARDAGAIAGKTVLLVDDVFTTGSTADACAAALLSGGAERVYLMTFAAGPNENYQ
jgi:competence protein ComFC